MTTLDLPLSIVTNMLNQASNGEELIGILNAVTSPDPMEDTAPTVSEPEEDEPSDEELAEVRDDVVAAILEVEDFDPEIIQEELDTWDSLPDEAFLAI